MLADSRENHYICSRNINKEIMEEKDYRTDYGKEDIQTRYYFGRVSVDN